MLNKMNRFACLLVIALIGTVFHPNLALADATFQAGEQKEEVFKRGKWNWNPDGISLKKGGWGLNYLAPKTKGNTLKDGIISVDLELGPRAKLSLMGRTNLPLKHPKEISGYELRMSQKRLLVVSHQKGIEKTLVRSKAYGKKMPTAVTLTLAFVGDNLVGTLLDRMTKKVLLNIHLKDSQWCDGLAAYGVYHKDKKSKLLRYQVRNSDVIAQSVTLFPSQAISSSTLGKWSTQNKELVLTKPEEPKTALNVWTLARPKNRIANGVVETKVALGSNPDFSLMTRTQLNGHQMSGYGLSLEKNKLLLYKWTDGKAKPMSSSVILKKPPESLAIKLISIENVISAVVQDGETYKPLAVISAHDTAYESGQAAFRAYADQDQDTKVLSIELTGGHTHYHGLFALFGKQVFATFQSPLPESVLSWKLNIISKSEKDVEILLKNRHWLQALINKGAKPIAATGQIPYRARSRAYRKYQNKGIPERKDGLGYDLTQSFKDKQMVEKALRGYAEKYSDIATLETLGTTANGNTIWALRVTNKATSDQEKPMVLLNGAHHGAELLTIDFALDALQHVLINWKKNNPSAQAWVNELDMWFVPLVNPDGNHCLWELDENTGRKNCPQNLENQDGYYGVDLNRNYPFKWGSLGEKGSRSWERSYYYRGPSAGSELETQAMMTLANQYKPAAVLSWHTYANTIISPYTIDHVKQTQPDVPWSIAEGLISNMEKAPGRKTPMRIKHKIYSVDGTDQDWHYFENGSIAYILEGPQHNTDSPIKRKTNLDYMRPIFTRLLDHVLKGPRISGHVKTTDGKPLKATVMVEEWKTRNGEKWNTRDSGYFDRQLHKPGNYTVRVEAEGYKTELKKVKVKGPHVINVTLIEK